MPLGDFRSVFLPYCLQKQTDGRYLVLNREYKPVGFRTRAFVTYEEYPIAVSLKGLGPSLAVKLSCSGKAGVDQIFLYDDGCVPTDSPENMKDYLAKLALLAKLKIADP